MLVCADADMAPSSYCVEPFKLLDGGLRDGGWMGEGRPKGAEDIAQDAFVRLFERWDGLPRIADPIFSPNRVARGCWYEELEMQGRAAGTAQRLRVSDAEGRPSRPIPIETGENGTPGWEGDRKGHRRGRH
jgi:hypothetical protein